MSRRYGSTRWPVVGLLVLVLALALGTPGSAAHAAQGDLLKTVDIPAAARCSSGSDSGTAVAIISGGLVGFPKVPIALITSCVEAGQAKLFLIDPAPSPAAVLKTVNTTVTPTGGWQSLGLRADKTDLIGCGIVGTAPVVYAIDVKASPATATFLFNGPPDSTCDGLTWDFGATPKAIYQNSTRVEPPDVLRLSESGTSLGGDLSAGCPGGDGTMTGLSVGVTTTTIGGEVPVPFSGPIMFVACPATNVGTESATPDTIRMIARADSTFLGELASPTPYPGDVECDGVTFAIWQSWHSTIRNKDVLWVKDTDPANPHQVFAVEVPFAACGPVPPPPPCPEADADSDGDGLLDCWEDGKYWSDGKPGIRYTGAWTIPVPNVDNTSERTVTLCLDIDNANKFGPAGGACATKDKRDIFLEMDYMQFHKLFSDAVNDVVNAFDAAPAFNLALVPGKCVGASCTAGIRFHLHLDEQIAHVDRLALSSCTGPLVANDPGNVDFDAIKAGTAPTGGGFGTATERGTLNAVAAKRFAYHYGVSGHNQAPTPPATSTSSSGCAEYGNDLIVTLGSWAVANCVTNPTLCVNNIGHNVGSRAEQAATLLHEFGHNLRLRHGGDDETNCKPNYESVMNYALQMPNTIAGRPLDFSRDALLPLNENSLNETGSLGGVPRSTKVAFGPLTGFPPKPTVSTVGLGGTVNWNRDADSADINVRRDITALTSSSGGCAPSATPDVLLTGFNDWQYVELNLRASTGFADGVGLSFDNEITLETALELSRDIIDIKPSGDPKNTINIGASTALQVAIMSRRECDDPGCVVEIDTTTMDRSTIILRGTVPSTWVLRVRQDSRGNFDCRAQDANKDGLLDLICKFDVSPGTLSPVGTQRAVLEGTIPDFLPPKPDDYYFRGSATMRVVN